MGINIYHVIDHLGLGGGQMSQKTLVENTDSERLQPLICALRPKPEKIPIDAEIITLNYKKSNKLKIKKYEYMEKSKKKSLIIIKKIK